MKVLIDFDDVIFNTKKFKEDLASLFFELGVSKEIFEQTYYAGDDQKIVRSYDPLAQMERIKKVCNIDSEKLLEAINEFMESSKEYVFSDIFSFTESVGTDNIYIISFGDIKFQKEKIESSGISKWIKNVFITDKLKAEMVETIINDKNIDGEKIFFLDDRVEQINDVKEKFPHIVTIFVKRPEGRYQDMLKSECCNHEVHNLKEALGIINEDL